MKRITAIAIVAAAILGCSYVGGTYAASCAVGYKNIDIQRGLGMYDAVVFSPEVVGTLKDACKLARRYQKAGASAEFYEKRRVELLAVVANIDADDVARAQMVNLMSDSMDVGFYGMVQDR